MRDREIWSAFEHVYCLTFEGDIDRQRQASAELCSVGLHGFRFVEGVKADSDSVREHYRAGKVKSFPPCFRCGLLSCGSDKCNNILTARQVGKFLSFINVFKIAMGSGAKTFLLFEDSVKFFDYASTLAEVAFSYRHIEGTGFFSDDPCLLSFGREVLPNEIISFDGTFAFVPRGKSPQNAGFAFNRAFAARALSQFQSVSHTGEIYVHAQIAEQAAHYSLEPPLSCRLPLSRTVLPERRVFDGLAGSNAMRAIDRRAVDRPLDHVKRIPIAVLGVPRGGTKYMSHALRQYGLDIGHESIGADGIASWLFAVSDTDLPFGSGPYGNNSRFVFADTTIAVIRTSPRAVFSTQIENMKNIQSFAFRKRWIKASCDVDVGSFGTNFEQALATYIFWYRIIIARRPVAWIKLERAADDLERLFVGKVLAKRRDADPASLRDPVNDRKPYLGQIYDPIVGDFSASLHRADPFLVRHYHGLRNELFAMFGDVV